jgi:hypothetical protein
MANAPTQGYSTRRYQRTLPGPGQKAPLMRAGGKNYARSSGLSDGVNSPDADDKLFDDQHASKFHNSFNM